MNDAEAEEQGPHRQHQRRGGDSNRPAPCRFARHPEKSQRAQCEGWPNQQTVSLSGYHFVQEDSPLAMAAAIEDFAQGVFRAT